MRCRSRQLGRFVLFVLALHGGGPARADDEAPLPSLPTLVDEDADGHEAAVEAWLALSVPDRVSLARAALVGEDLAAARAASLLVGWPDLSVAETRRAASLRAEQPAWWFRVPAGLGTEEPSLGSYIGLGSVDWPVAMRAAVAHPEDVDPDDLELLHRVARPEHADVLAEVVATCPEEWLGPLSLTCSVMADCDRSERHREGLARCFLTFVERRRLQGEDDDARQPAAAMPEGFDAQHEALLRAWIAERRGDGDTSSDLSLQWLRRVTEKRTYTEADVPLLEALVDAAGSQRYAYAPDRYLALTAMRKLVALAPGKATVVHSAKEFAGGSDPLGEAALAAWAGTGDPEARALLDREEGGWDDLDPDWRWLADRARMRDEALAVLLDDEAERDAQDVAQTCEAYGWGVRQDEQKWAGMGPDDDDVAWLGDQLAGRHAEPDLLLAWHMFAEPGSLDRERARLVLERLDEGAPPRWVAEYERAFGAVLVELLELEADHVRALLVTWVRSGDRHVVEAFAPWCLRLGLDVDPEVLARGWSTWTAEDAAELGRHPDPAVGAFLRMSLVASEPEARSLATGALLMRAGVDPRVVRRLIERAAFPDWGEDGDEEEERDGEEGGAVFDILRDALREGDVTGAVLVLAERARDLSPLVYLAGDRVLAWLRAQRDDPRSPLASEAELALGWSGTDSEKQVLARFVAEGRTWILENKTTEGMPDGPIVDTVVELLDTNCCLGWVAAELLNDMYPVVLDGDTAWGGQGTQATRERLRSFRWVPTPWDGTPTAVRAQP